MIHATIKSPSPEAALMTAGWLGLGQHARYFYDPMDNIPGRAATCIVLRFPDECKPDLFDWYWISGDKPNHRTLLGGQTLRGGIICMNRDNSQ